MHPKAIGDRTEAWVLAALLHRYDTVLMPWGENSRYDLLIDDAGRFIRVQCKTGHLGRGAVSFRTCSSTYHHPTHQGLGSAEDCAKDYRGEADMFGVYCVETGAVYLVPVDDVGTAGASLRVEPARNGQQSGIRWARDYQVDTGPVRDCSLHDSIAGTMGDSPG